MIVLVTGASSGVGKFTAEEFLKKGHIVYGTSRNPKDLKNGVKMIELDVCDENSCKNAVKHIEEEEGRLDILVNNAGMGVAGAVEMTSDEEAKIQFETNFFGVHRMCRAVLPLMRKNNFGKILNVTSVAASVPLPFQSMYSAGKAAVEVISHALAMETKTFNISVTSLEFGDMKTGFTKNRVVTEASLKDAEMDRVYSDTFTKSIQTMEADEQNGPEPIKAAKIIVKTAMKKRSKPMIVCGLKYKLVVMLRRGFPMRFTNWIIGVIYAKH